MPSDIQAKPWITAQVLHQVQLLSCDLCDLNRWDSPDLGAPYWRLYWHDREGAEIGLGGRVLPLLPGNLYLVPPSTHFAARLRLPVRQLFVHFLVEPAWRGRAGQVYSVSTDTQLGDLCARIAGQLQRDAACLRASLWAQALVSLSLLEIPSRDWAARYEDSRITLAVEAIARAYPSRLSNAQLAEQVHLHPSAFARLFRRCTGRSPLEHLIHLRLEEACLLLHQDDATIDEIAARTGFGDRAYFSRVFSKVLNCPPAHYRKLVNVSGRLRPQGRAEDRYTV